MATVTDSSLLSAAQDIVTEFMDDRVSLNDGVIKKASELGLNNDQTARLIERTNTEAFLRLFPGTTEFEVASPEVVLGIKTASVHHKPQSVHTPDISSGRTNVGPECGMFKAASVNNDTYVSNPRDTYSQKVASIKLEEIFGMDDEFLKTARQTEYEYAINSEARSMCRALGNVYKTASEINEQNLARELAYNDALNDLSSMIKQAALSGTQSIKDSEHELLNMFPEEDQLIRSVYDSVTTKLAFEVSDTSILERSKDVLQPKLAHSSELTNKFQKLRDIYRG